MKLVGVCAATRWELNAIRRAIRQDRRHIGPHRRITGQRGECDVIGVRTGVGMAKAKDACRTLFEGQHPDLVISCGFACALGSSAIGDLLIGADVVIEKPNGAAQAKDALRCDSHVIESARRAAEACRMPVRAGRFVTVPRVLWRADDKRRIAIRTGAIGLDMESAAIGEVAFGRGVPFAVIRTVSDLLDEDLPLDFNLFLNPIDWPMGTLACLTRPSSLLGLTRLRSQAAMASDRLTIFFRRFFNDLHD
jgi:adenosylhomocysteine nucleosidase